MTALDSTHDPLDPLVEGQRLFRLGHLPAAIRLAQRATASPALAPQARLLLARCLTAQGRYRQAEVVYRAALEALPAESEVAWEIRLWRAFLQIYLTADPIPAITEGRTALAWAQARPDLPCLTALAQNLLGQALALASTWGLEPPTRMAEARNLLVEAVDAYRRLGDSEESLGALLQLGQLHLWSPDADQAAARVIFQQAQAQAVADKNLARQAETALRLAELDFDAALTQRAIEPETQIDPTPYQQAMALYEAARHILGPADVLLSLGRRLIGAGFDGTKALQQALHLYRREENLNGIHNALSALGTWHVQQGELGQALDCHRQAAEVAQEMSFPLGQATAYLGIGDYFFRVSDYAKALAHYEQAGNLAALPVVGAIVGLTLANAYTLMNLPERAETACRAAIAALTPAGASDRLSLAYFTLGNVLTGKGDWAGAIVAWRDGLAVDEARHNQRGQAEKLQNIAQATVMQHYHPDGPPIPDMAYEEAMHLYTQAIAMLDEIGDREAKAAIAGTYQLQGQTANTCGRPLDALRYLEQARSAYAALGLAMQVATTDTLLGLLCYDLGGRSPPDFYTEAVRYQERALDYFQAAGMRDMAWKVRFYLAQTAFRRGLLALTGSDQHAHWLDATRWLEEAAADIEFVRGRFIEADPVARESARLGLVSDKEKVYTFALQLYHWYLKDARSAFNWLEKLKGRAFLDALALTSLHPPALADETLMDSERGLLVALQHASTQAEVTDLSERLHSLWDRMTADSAATEYVDLRRGKPISWEETCSLLQGRVSKQER